MTSSPSARLRSAAAKRGRAHALLEESGRELVAAFEDAIGAGMSAEDAAALAGMSKQAVYQLRKRLARR
jgi:hypothetical protein